MPMCIFLMQYYDNWSPACLCYTAMHGSYGLLWLLKHFTFRDPKWDVKTTVMGSINSFLTVLGPYWIAAYLLMSKAVEEPSMPWCAFCVVMYVLGVTMMMVADAHKHFVLRAKRGLITDGLFTYIRHPNYTGEMLLYGSFAALVGHPVPWLVLAWVWGMIFFPNMLAKEASMSRYPEWAGYYARSGMLLPPLSSLF